MMCDLSLQGAHKYLTNIEIQSLGVVEKTNRGICSRLSMIQQLKKHNVLYGLLLSLSVQISVFLALCVRTINDV